jgi:cyclophilin family peptidyl-prolyl cis-trans isomerase
MKRIILSSIIMAMAALAAVSCSSCSSGNQQEAPENETAEMENVQINEPEFDIVTTHGTMRVKLYGKTPKHRDNFTKLVADKYYEGIRFHRVIEGFMIQAGDPYSRDTSKIDMWGQGGPDYTVPAEFVNEYWHKKGAIAAARRGDMANPTKASSGSQFYIVHDENACLHLDGQYTIFGEVISGLEVIDKIATVDTDRYDRPYDDIFITAINPVVEIEPIAVNVAPADSTQAK